MTNKNKAIVIAIVAGLGVIGGNLYFNTNEKNETTYQDVSQEIKKNNYTKVDGETDLTNFAKKDLNSLKKWELEKEKYGKKPYNPPEFLNVVAKTPDELIELLNTEKNKLLTLKQKFDSVDCLKIKEKSDCNNTKKVLDGVENKYSKIVTELEKFNTYGKLY